jgi:predicted lysophospholipase L1 biosynthesis ABC-type transport system permease subunit
MTIRRAGLVRCLRTWGSTALGVVLSCVPLALWVAWTETMLAIVAAVGVVSAVLIVLLADSGPEGAERRRPQDGPAGRVTLPDESVREIHRLFPLTYHHSLNERARFRQAMDRVRLLLMPPGR